MQAFVRMSGCAGISTDPEKVRVIKEWPVPEDESQLKVFLGTASYYRQFVPNYADIAAPLQSASQKGERFRWTTQCEEAFESIKRKLMNAAILAFPQLDETLMLATGVWGQCYLRFRLEKSVL